MAFSILTFYCSNAGMIVLSLVQMIIYYIFDTVSLTNYLLPVTIFVSITLFLVILGAAYHIPFLWQSDGVLELILFTHLISLAMILLSSMSTIHKYLLHIGQEELYHQEVANKFQENKILIEIIFSFSHIFMSTTALYAQLFLMRSLINWL